MNEVIECDIFSTLKPKQVVKVEEKVKDEDLAVDMDYIAIVQPGAKIVREYFKEIAEELNQLVWK